MNLQNINVCSQPLDAAFHGVENVLAREANAVDQGAVVRGHGRNWWLGAGGVDAEIHLGEYDDAGAGDFEDPQRLSDKLLGLSIAICVGLETSARFHAIREHMPYPTN